MRFDHRLAAIEFLLHTLLRALRTYQQEAAFVQSLVSFLSALDGEENPLRAAREHLSQRERAVQVRKDCGVLSARDEAAELAFSRQVHTLIDNADDLCALRAACSTRTRALDAQDTLLQSQLENAIRFIHNTFGAGQELLIFLTQLESQPDARRFLQRSALYSDLMQTVLPDGAPTSGTQEAT